MYIYLLLGISVVEIETRVDSWNPTTCSNYIFHQTFFNLHKGESHVFYWNTFVFSLLVTKSENYKVHLSKTTMWYHKQKGMHMYILLRNSIHISFIICTYTLKCLYEQSNYFHFCLYAVLFWCQCHFWLLLKYSWWCEEISADHNREMTSKRGLRPVSFKPKVCHISYRNSVS